ncbi:HBS1-like protein [Holothuria leucospilota]|uniref:HBS1-like protein n=1 Tax=Holothuria leucospilota TaxID=206669 RepID=A0A9Q1BVN0_HOLLE|nr:HBS1-like protein [Holothuria leucospilota]
MSRHRSVRGMNYDDDYDGYDDVYGHSVEDDYGVSPSTAAEFMYRGSHRGHQLSSYLENIGEEENDDRLGMQEPLADSGSFQKPQLSESDEVRLQSCLDEIRSIVGETVPEHVIVTKILESGFGFETALDSVLNYQDQETERRQKEKPGNFATSRNIAGATQITEIFSQSDIRSNVSSFDKLNEGNVFGVKSMVLDSTSLGKGRMAKDSEVRFEGPDADSYLTGYGRPLKHPSGKSSSFLSDKEGESLLPDQGVSGHQSMSSPQVMSSHMQPELHSVSCTKEGLMDSVGGNRGIKLSSSDMAQSHSLSMNEKQSGTGVSVKGLSLSDLASSHLASKMTQVTLCSDQENGAKGKNGSSIGAYLLEKNKLSPFKGLPHKITHSSNHSIFQKDNSKKGNELSSFGNPSLSDLAGLHLSSQSKDTSMSPRPETTNLCDEVVEESDGAPLKEQSSGAILSSKTHLRQTRKKKRTMKQQSGDFITSTEGQSALLHPSVMLSKDFYAQITTDTIPYDSILGVSPLLYSTSSQTYLAEPSNFAMSLCSRYSHPCAKTAGQKCSPARFRRFDFKRQASLSKYHKVDYSLEVSPFDFSTPSPDDIVKERQKAAFQRAPLQTPNTGLEDPLQKRLKEESAADLSRGVAEMSFAGQSEAKVGFEVKEPPKVKVQEVATPAGAMSPDRRGSMPKVNSSSDLSVLTSTPTRKESKTKPLVSISSDIDILKEYSERQGGKELLNMVVIGHVDAGKSTLMGHLLFLLGQVNKRTMHKYETESKKQGKASFAYAWVLDETGEERERGITMDVGLTKFETEHRIVTLLDAPGHKDFIPNMISGAAQADVAILVVDATRGEFETGFESGGQTREHAILARSLGVTQLAVAVNKMDTVDWSEERFNEIVGKLKAFLKKTGFKDSEVVYIPCSGLGGENLVKRADNKELSQWYKGPCLLEQIDVLKAPPRPIDKPFRMCVSDVFKGIGAGISVCGKIESGSVVIGDKIFAMPSVERGIIKGISVHEEDAKWACAGDQSVLVITGIDQNKVNVGDVLCSRTDPIKTTTRFQARIIVFDIEVPITKGFLVLLHYQAVSEPAVIKKLISTLHKSTGEVLQKKPKCLTKNSNAVVEIETSRPICIELYKDHKDLGRFMLRYSGSTIAAGLVTQIKES